MKNIEENTSIQELKFTAKQELTNILAMSTEKTPPNLTNFIKTKIQNKKVAIYGGGQMGHFVLSALDGIPVEYILDKNSDKLININGIDVIYPDTKNICDEDKDNTVVIVCIVFEKSKAKDDVYSLLASLGYTHIMNLADIWYYHESKCYDAGNESEYEFYNDKKNEILEVVDLLGDENSVIIYKDFIKAAILRQSEYYAIPHDDELAYFVDDITFNKGFSRFIECGALDGNTIAELIGKMGKIEKLAIFEPDSANFKTTLKYIKKNKEQIANEVYMYPCAVWSGEERIEFNENCMGASRINKSGTSIIQCACIDDTLLDFDPTFVKMDIEGAEYDALLGAKQTIIKNKPDMAICIYHLLDHMWEVISLINSWNLGYKFYMRTHACFGFGTTLYAIAD